MGTHATLAGKLLHLSVDHQEAPVHRVYLTPLPVRVWHLVNALAMLALMATGAQLRWPDVVGLGVDYRRAVLLHDAAGLTVTAFYFWWLLYYAATRRLLKLYVPTLRDIWPGFFRQAKWYFVGFFRGEPEPYDVTPDNKFNPMQKFFYAFLMFAAMPLLCGTGVVLMEVTPLRWWLSTLGGIKIAIGLHFLLGAFIVMFLFMHLYLATLGPTVWGPFRTIWSGWHVTPAPPGRKPE